MPLIDTQTSHRSTPVRLSRRRLLGIGLGAGTVFALNACGGTTTVGGAAGAETGVISWAWQLPTTWDPVTSSAGSDVQMLALAYDAMTALDETGNAVGWLAERWRYNADGTEVTFTLRPGLRFSDGSPLDAVAVAKSLNRARSEEGSLVAPQLVDVEEITARGKRNVVVKLTETNYQYPLLLAGKTGMIVNPAAFEADAGALATQPAGSGPFSVLSYVENDHAELERNPNFHLADQILVDRFQLYPQPDPATAVASASSGQYNVVRVVASAMDAAKAAGLEVQVLDSTFVSLLDVNTTMPPFDQPAVVEAMKYGIDRAGIAEVTFFGTGDPNYQPFPPGYVGHDDELADLFAYDPDRARQILADAGLGDGVEGVLSAPSPTSPAVEQIQAQLKEVGIDLTIETVPQSEWTQQVYIERSKALGYDGFAGRESPVQAFQVLFSSTGLMNPARNDDPELLKKIAQVKRTPTDDPDYPRLLKEATRTAVTRFPNTFLYNAPFIVIRQPAVTELPQLPSLRRFEGISA